MALADINSLIKALAQSQNITPFYKAGVTTFAAGSAHSLWTTAGEPNSGAAPAYNAVAPVSTLAGAMPLVDALINQLNVARLSFNAATPGYYLLYDRISHSGGLVGNSTGSQSISAGTAATTRTKAPFGAGCRMFVEWYATTGTGTPTLTVTYTNSDGVTGRTGTAVWPDSPVAGQMLRVPLQAGDVGIRSVQAAQLSAATSAAGSWGITIINPITDVNIQSANGGIILDAFGCGLPTVANGAALAWMLVATATTQGAIFGQTTIIDI